MSLDITALDFPSQSTLTLNLKWLCMKYEFTG